MRPINQFAVELERQNVGYNVRTGTRVFNILCDHGIDTEEKVLALEWSVFRKWKWAGKQTWAAFERARNSVWPKEAS